MRPIHELLARWAEQTELLRECGAVMACETLNKAANELRQAIEETGRELLDPSAASTYSGLTTRRLRQLVEAGELENVGRKGAPLYRRSDLPRRAAPPQAADRTREPRRGDGFDPAAEALRIVSGGQK